MVVTGAVLLALSVRQRFSSVPFRMISFVCCAPVSGPIVFLAVSPQLVRPAVVRVAQWSGRKVFRERGEHETKTFLAEVYRGLARSGQPVIIAKARASTDENAAAPQALPPARGVRRRANPKLGRWPGGQVRGCPARRARSGYRVCSIRKASTFIVWALLPVVTARNARTLAASARFRAPRTGAT